MGYALIIGGGTDGRYTISLDIGEAERAALVARFTAQAAEAQAKVMAAQGMLVDKTAELAAAAQAYNDATDAYIALQRGETEIEDAEQLLGIVNGYFEAQAAYLRALSAHEAALSNKNALAFSASHLTKALATWQALVLTETRDAWCADLTEDATGYVETLEIPGESELMLIAPGGTYPVLATSGYMRSRALMSPWQAFFNAAVLPGWQKFKPTYRWGTITALDENADTATVELAEARSSAQRLLVNQSNTLTGIPVVYMTCNAEAFEVGDNVVVEFQGQDWGAPRVIGFLDNPKPCGGWRLSVIGLSQASVGGPPRYLNAVFESLASTEQYYSDMAAATAIDVDFRIDRGDWTIPIGPTTGPITYGTWENPKNSNDYVIGGLGLDLVEPGKTPINDGSAFISFPGAPAHFRIRLFIDSGWSSDALFQPVYPYDCVIEARLRLDGQVYADIAVRVGFAPYAIDSGKAIPADSDVLQLDYVRFVEDGT